jgi:glutathione synthase/RimK-type ligase-like ATP-grasp enzyme
VVVDATRLQEGQAHLSTLLTTGDVLVQPFLKSVLTEGELSVVILDGRAEYAARKRPASGEVRIHYEWGGTVEPADLAADMAQLAERAIEAAGLEHLYARADLVRGDAGALVVMELEMIDPELYLGFVPGTADLVTDAFVRRVGASHDQATRPGASDLPPR